MLRWVRVARCWCCGGSQCGCRGRSGCGGLARGLSVVGVAVGEVVWACVVVGDVVLLDVGDVVCVLVLWCCESWCLSLYVYGCFAVPAAGCWVACVVAGALARAGVLVAW